MVSIKDIAKTCGVSVATVSKALNDQNDISKATKAKIIRTAEEMGYMANLSARALKTNRTYNIGVLYADNGPGLAHEYFSNILDAFKSEAEAHGYDITFINEYIAGKKVSYKKHVEYRKFDGVGIINANFHDKQIADLSKGDIPIVAIDYVYENCASVSSDNFTGINALIDYAAKMGHKKIAYIHGEDTRVSSDRLSGFYSAMYRNGLEIREDYILQGTYHDPEICETQTRKLLKLKDKPTCILFPDDYSAIGGIKVINEHNEKISYMGYDGIEIGKVLGITTYEQNKSSLGKTAARKLIEIIDDPKREREHIIVNGQFLQGRTVKKI